jgi:hypothetical protein
MLDDAVRQLALGAQPLGLTAAERGRCRRAASWRAECTGHRLIRFAGIRIGPGRHAHDKPLIMTAPSERDMPDDLGTNLAGAIVP